MKEMNEKLESLVQVTEKFKTLIQNGNNEALYQYCQTIYNLTENAEKELTDSKTGLHPNTAEKARQNIEAYREHANDIREQLFDQGYFDDKIKQFTNDLDFNLKPEAFSRQGSYTKLNPSDQQLADFIFTQKNKPRKQEILKKTYKEKSNPDIDLTTDFYEEYINAPLKNDVDHKTFGGVFNKFPQSLQNDFHNIALEDGLLILNPRDISDLSATAKEKTLTKMRTYFIENPEASKAFTDELNKDETLKTELQHKAKARLQKINDDKELQKKEEEEKKQDNLDTPIIDNLLAPEIKEEKKEEKSPQSIKIETPEKGGSKVEIESPKKDKKKIEVENETEKDFTGHFEGTVKEVVKDAVYNKLPFLKDGQRFLFTPKPTQNISDTGWSNGRDLNNRRTLLSIEEYVAGMKKNLNKRIPNINGQRLMMVSVNVPLTKEQKEQLEELKKGLTDPVLIREINKDGSVNKISMLGHDEKNNVKQTTLDTKKLETLPWSPVSETGKLEKKTLKADADELSYTIREDINSKKAHWVPALTEDQCRQIDITMPDGTKDTLANQLGIKPKLDITTTPKLKQPFPDPLKAKLTGDEEVKIKHACSTLDILKADDLTEGNINAKIQEKLDKLPKDTPPLKIQEVKEKLEAMKPLLMNYMQRIQKEKEEKKEEEKQKETKQQKLN